MRNKPEDNKYFHYYNANPKDKETKDCTYRALSLFLDKSWAEVAELDAEFYLSHGMWLYTTEIDGYEARSRVDDFMTERGCKVVYSEYRKDKRIGSIKEFLDNQADPDEVYLCEVSGHMLAIKDNKVWDTWDSSCQYPNMIFARSNGK